MRNLSEEADADHPLLAHERGQRNGLGFISSEGRLLNHLPVLQRDIYSRAPIGTFDPMVRLLSRDNTTLHELEPVGQIQSSDNQIRPAYCITTL